MHVTPPPYVPTEYRSRKYSELPEPYKSEVDEWIGRTTAHYGARVTTSVEKRLVVFGVVVILVVVVAMAFTLFLGRD